jgi:hypothetical protein
MTAQEKAKAGLWFIKEAVLQYLADHPEGVRTVKARRELGLENRYLFSALFWSVVQQSEWVKRRKTRRFR